MKSYEDILKDSGVTEEQLVSLLREQTELLGKIPFERFEYGVNCEPTVDETRYPVLQKIHPRKRAAVERILNSDIPDTVEKIVIFGSSLGLHCKAHSDLDIAIVGSRKSRDERCDPWLYTLNLGEADFLYLTPEEYTDSNSSAYVSYDVRTEGVVVWETFKEPNPTC